MGTAIEILFSEHSNGVLPDQIHQYISGNIRHQTASIEQDNGYDLSLNLIKALPATPSVRNWNSAAKLVFRSYCENVLGVSRSEFSKEVLQRFSTDELADLTENIVIELKEIAADCDPVQIDFEALSVELGKRKKNVNGPSM